MPVDLGTPTRAQNSGHAQSWNVNCLFVRIGHGLCALLRTMTMNPTLRHIRVTPKAHLDTDSMQEVPIVTLHQL
jgi:hypothetical protein